MRDVVRGVLILAFMLSITAAASGGVWAAGCFAIKWNAAACNPHNWLGR